MQTSFLDILQSSLSSGTDTAAKSSENEQNGSQNCECGKGTLGCLIHPNTPDEWIASMRDSLARTLALPGIKRALEKRHDPAYIGRSCVSLASFDPDTCSLRMSQQSFLTDLEPYSQTLPRWGSMRNGVVSEHPIVAHPISETDGSCWPSTDATLINLNEPVDSVLKRRAQCKEKYGNNGFGLRLQTAVKMWPTPDANMAFRGGTTKTGKRPSGAARQTSINDKVKQLDGGGTLNPDWVEWLMEFPIGFTDSKDWVTRKSRSKQPLPGNSLEENK